MPNELRLAERFIGYNGRYQKIIKGLVKSGKFSEAHKQWRYAYLVTAPRLAQKAPDAQCRMLKKCSAPTSGVRWLHREVSAHQDAALRSA